MPQTIRDKRTGQYRGSIGSGKSKIPTAKVAPVSPPSTQKPVKQHRSGLAGELLEAGPYVFITKFPFATSLWPNYKNDPELVRLITQIGKLKGSKALVEEQANSEDERHRKWAAMQPKISDAAARKLASDDSETIRVKIAKNGSVPEDIRTMAVLSLTKPLPPEPEPWVKNPNAKRVKQNKLKEFSKDLKDTGKTLFIVKVPYATKIWPNYIVDDTYRHLYAIKLKGTRGLVEAESDSKILDHRKWAASQPKISKKTAEKLAVDENEHVRTRISKNLNVPEHIRTMAALTLTPPTQSR